MLINVFIGKRKIRMVVSPPDEYKGIKAVEGVQSALEKEGFIVEDIRELDE